MKTEDVTKYQNKIQAVLLRSQINFADYNPRVISEKALRSLKANIKKVGLLGGIVVNKSTMNIVSGHQRITALDLLNKDKDYKIIVELVELTEQQEREQNIFMNSTTVQGEFDIDKLAALLPNIDYKASGLDDYDISNIAAESPNIEMGNSSEVESDIQDMDIPYEERKAAIKEKKAKQMQTIDNQQMNDPFFTVAFDDYESKAEFLGMFGLNPDDKYIKGEILFDNIMNKN